MLHLAPLPSSSPHHAFLPAIPSPLSPRSANIYGPRHNYMSTTPDHVSKPHPQASGSSSSKSPAITKSAVPFSQRPVKKAPSPKQAELKDRRRDEYLSKIRDRRDSRRYEARGEDMMRMDFLQHQRDYERRMALSAPVEEDFEEAELPSWSQPGSQMQISSQQEEVEADEFAREEEAEMRALLEYMPDDEEVMDEDGEATSLWSDDVDYDQLFSEVMEQPQHHGATVSVQQSQNDEEMDMS